MDRFIAKQLIADIAAITNLKSNMDRFIVQSYYHFQKLNPYLKSNMDRFIENAVYVSNGFAFAFKIQYG